MVKGQPTAAQMRLVPRLTETPLSHLFKSLCKMRKIEHSKLNFWKKSLLVWLTECVYLHFVGDNMVRYNLGPGLGSLMGNRAKKNRKPIFFALYLTKEPGTRLGTLLLPILKFKRDWALVYTLFCKAPAKRSNSFIQRHVVYLFSHWTFCLANTMLDENVWWFSQGFIAAGRY